MHKKKYLILLVCITLCLIFLSFINTVGASKPTPTPTPSPTPTPTSSPSPTPNPSPTPTASPTPTPTPFPIHISMMSSGTILPSLPNPTNLAPIPSAWYLTYGSGPQIIHLDNTVVHNGKPSIRLDQHTSADVNVDRECDSIWLAVKPGDHIVFSCWMKTTSSGLGDTNPFSGARIGIDFYDSKRITGVQSDGQHGYFPNEDDQAIANNYVNWGTSVWTKRTIDFVVPNTMGSDGYYYSINQQRTPTGMIVWMQVWSSTYGSTDSGQAWFSNATVYINP